MTGNVEMMFKEPDIWGPTSGGHDVIWQGRVVPKLKAIDQGAEIMFILDNRLGWSFPREWAFHALDMMANAMAIGAGYPCFTAEEKFKPFAPKASFISEETGDGA